MRPAQHRLEANLIVPSSVLLLCPESEEPKGSMKKECHMVSNCAYCGKNPPIENSHILPKWTIRHALDGSVTGKLRATDDINYRLQDAEKVPLLCRDCENLFSKVENEAAKQFRVGAIAHGGTYNADFFRFLVTILWRVGKVRTDRVRDEAARFSTALNSRQSRS